MSCVVELLVALRPRKQNVNPDGHGFRRGRDQVVGAVKRLHTKGQFGRRRLDRPHVVRVHFLYSLETHRAFQPRLRLVREVEDLKEKQQILLCNGVFV